MVSVWEVAGLAIVVGTLGQIAVNMYGGVRRRALEERNAQRDARFFETRAKLLLEAERSHRDRAALSWNGDRKFYVDRKVEEAKDVMSFYLRPHDGKALAPYRPGQYLTFHLKIADEPRPVVRCYSLSDAPGLEYYRVTIKRLGPPPGKPDAPPGLSSNFFHEALNEGDILNIQTPKGHFFLDQTTDKPVVLIGGGVGLTPVLSMLNAICRSGGRRETWLFYGATNRTEHAMYDHLAEVRRQYDNVHIVVCYSRPTDACVAGRDYDHDGFVSMDLFKELLPSNNYTFHVCGPPPMMESLTTGLREWGVPDEDVKFEAFGPATIKRKAPPPAAQDAAAVATAGDGIEVVFERSRKTLRWQPSCGSLLDLAEANGINIDSGCRAGNCGTCETAVKGGEVSYISEPGATLADGSCLPCIGIPRGPLALDS